MEDHLTPNFMDTKPEEDQPVATGSAADFEDATRPGDLWPEAADALCSEHAALFAGTQPAPLSVV
jgi:hypothetical protein